MQIDSTTRLSRRFFGLPLRAHARAGRAFSVLSRAGRILTDIILPRTCCACSVPIDPDERTFCETCAIDLARCVADAYCRHCGEDRGEHLLHNGVCTACTLGKTRPLSISSSHVSPRVKWPNFVRVGRYDGPLKRMILDFKTHCTLDRVLGGLLADAVCGMIDPSQIDLWVPIPTHWSRRLANGFQPTELLARAAVRHWGGRVESAIRMARYIEPFHSRPNLSTADRAREIAGAIQLVPGAGISAARSQIEGSHICLIDDVTTTGATLREAAKVLRQAGAATVSAAVLARAARNRAV